MNSLYLENSIIGSLFRFFSPYFSTATRPTQFMFKVETKWKPCHKYIDELVAAYDDIHYTTLPKN